MRWSSFDGMARYRRFDARGVAAVRAFDGLRVTKSMFSGVV
jgi:hypothetical protein